MRCPLLLPIAMASAGCGLNNLPDPAIVTTPRILAVRASPPEVSPGEAVTLDALVALVPPGATYTWSLCQVDPILGAASCAQAANLTPLGVGTSLTMTVPSDALAQIPPAQQLSGISLFVALEVSSGGATLSRPLALRAVQVSTNPTPNANTTIGWVTVGGSEHPQLLPAPSDVTLEGEAAPGSAQTYVDPSTGVTVTETLNFHWYVSGGTIDSDTTEPDLVTGLASTVWHYDGSAPPREWVVLYDSRSGIDWWVP